MIISVKNVYIWPFLALLVLVSGSFYGQTTKIDSLKKVVEQAPGDSTRVNNLNALSVAILRNEGISESHAHSRAGH